MFARGRSEPPFGSVVAPPQETVNAAGFATSGPRATGERTMLDPKEMKKGGFGAFAQRDRERREAEALKGTTPNGATPVAAPSTDAKPGTASPSAPTKT
jgi:hypothetical protein